MSEIKCLRGKCHYQGPACRQCGFNAEVDAQRRQLLQEHGLSVREDGRKYIKIPPIERVEEDDDGQKSGTADV